MTSTLTTARLRPQLKLDAIFVPDPFTDADLPTLAQWAIERGAVAVTLSRSMYRGDNDGPNPRLEPDTETRIRVARDDELSDPNGGHEFGPGLWLIHGSAGALFTISPARFEAEYELA